MLPPAAERNHQDGSGSSKTLSTRTHSHDTRHTYTHCNGSAILPFFGGNSACSSLSLSVVFTFASMDVLIGLAQMPQREVNTFFSSLSFLVFFLARPI
mmetsp:Transcript_32497/g.69654  ORF Transcript_32497/g.69654 Transcript_32497/m.69654 type:complete len:98 (+) Transcript_32497:98-391(+)